MKNFFLNIIFIFIACSNLLAEKEWTTFTYMNAASGSLTDGINAAIRSMENACKDYMSSSSSANFLIQAGNYTDNPDTTWRYELTQSGKVDAGSFSYKLGTDPVQELLDEATWIKANYPAKNYQLTLTSHGTGIGGMLGISLPELGQALMGITSILGKKINFLMLTGCVMGIMEVFYQLRNDVEYCVASQNITYNGRFGWGEVSENILKYSNIINGLNCANTIIENLKSVTAEYLSMGVVKMGSLQKLADNVNDMSNKILECAQQEYAEIKNVITETRSECVGFSQTSPRVDLYEFYYKLASKLEILLQGSTDPVYSNNLRETIRLLKEGVALFREVVCSEIHGSGSSNINGLSIHIPVLGESIKSYYYDLAFAIDNSWLQVLELYTS